MADGNKVLSFFRGAYPFLTTGLSLLGPPGNLASSILGNALKIDNPTQQKVMDALQQMQLTPDQQLAMTNAENQYRAQMQAMGYENEKDLEAVYAADRADARSMEEKTGSDLPEVLAILVTLGFFGLLGVWAFCLIPAANEKILDVMVGSLATAWVSIVNFYFGRSSEGDRKTELLAQAGPVTNS